MKIFEIARHLADSFVVRKRANGEQYISIDRAKDWGDSTFNIVQAAHGHKSQLPHDFIYRACHSMLLDISKARGDTEEFYENYRSEISTDFEYGNPFDWFEVFGFDYCDRYYQEFDWNIQAVLESESPTQRLVEGGQWLHKLDIFDLIWEELKKETLITLGE